MIRFHVFYALLVSLFIWGCNKMHVFLYPRIRTVMPWHDTKNFKYGTVPSQILIPRTCNLLSIYLFIYLGFNVTFNTVQVISRRVVGRAVETSTYSSSGICTVNCRPTASNYQLSHLRGLPGNEPRPPRCEVRVLPLYHCVPSICFQ